MTRADRIPGFSDADMAALSVFTEAAIATNKAVQELAHAVAADRGVTLAKPSPDRPRRKIRRLRIKRDANGVLVAEDLPPPVETDGGANAGEAQPIEIEREPAPQPHPEPAFGAFADVFGRIDP
jgi:hypothetical protein